MSVFVLVGHKINFIKYTVYVKENEIGRGIKNKWGQTRVIYEAFLYQNLWKKYWSWWGVRGHGLDIDVVAVMLDHIHFLSWIRCSNGRLKLTEPVSSQTQTSNIRWGGISFEISFPLRECSQHHNQRKEWRRFRRTGREKVKVWSKGSKGASR